MAINPGTTLGQYEVLEELGRGGMAVVYKARQTSLDRLVAIKVLPAFYAEDASFVERFRSEAISIASLRHPNILTVFDFGNQDGTYYIVMEFVPGGTLDDRLGKPLLVAEAVSLIRPVASALDYAHARNMLHRDVKPNNVLLTPEGTPILSDFGLAKMMEGTARLTRTGLTVGTPEYMSPEQAMGKAVGSASDQYSLAIMLYEAATGRVPYMADTPVAVVLAHLSDTPPPPRSINPDLPETVAAALLRGLEKDPSARYTTCSEMVDAVEAAGLGQTFVAAASPPPPQQTVVPAVAPPANVAAPTPPAPPQAPAAQPRMSDLEFQDVWVDLGSTIAFNAIGFQKAAEELNKRLAPYYKQGWEVIGRMNDPSLFVQARSLRGPTIRGANIPLRRQRV